MGTLNDRGELDPYRGVIIGAFGRKGSGKSVIGLLYFESYPFDRIVIDVNGDDGPHHDVIELRGTVDELPTEWPEELRPDDGRRMTLRYVPDTGSPTFLEDVDAVIGLAWRKGRVCILIHEIGLVAPAGRTPPHMRRLLNANRHRDLTAIFCGPRTMGVDPLVLAQCDLIHAFELPNPDDRKRLADAIGWNPAHLARELDTLRRHEFLRHDANEEQPEPGEPDLRLVSFDPLPADVVAQLKRL